MARKQSTSPWVWIFLLMMLASFVAFILYLDQKVVEQGAAGGEQRQEGGENKPTIDFYTVLRERKVEIPISEEEREAIENPSINKDAVGQAILQVGSFQSADEADSLKAQLAFLGLEAKIKSAVVNDETWHRVELGPFASETRLSRAKNLLIENRIDYMQRSLPN